MFDFDVLLCVLEDIHALSFRPDEWHQLKQNLGSNAGVASASDSRVDGQPHESHGCGSGGGVGADPDDDLRDLHDARPRHRQVHNHNGSGSVSLQLLRRLLATKDAKINSQAKMLKYYRQRCTRLQKQVNDLRSDIVNDMERESRDTLHITRVKSDRAKKKEVRCLESNKIDEYFSIKKKRLDAQDHIDASINEQGPGHTSRSQGWLTPEGTLSLAIRRNMSNCSAEDLGLVIMDDCSKQTVLRAECRSGAALMASAHQFFQQRDSELSDRHNEDDRCSFLWLQYREDATNSSKHRSKMTALELQASYVVAARHDLPRLSPKDLTCIRRLADVLPVHRGDGPATLALCKKMLESLGCPTWDTFVEQHEAGVVCPVRIGHIVASGSSESGDVICGHHDGVDVGVVMSWTHNSFVWIMCTTDRGPNEIWTKKVVQAKLMDVPWCFFLPADCYEHQAHLGVLGGLKLVDSLLAGRRKWKYFSSVAMLTNILRDISQDLYTAWRTLHGDESANKCVRTLFPRCIAERWGSIDLTETRLLKAGVPALRATMMRVFQCTEYNDQDNDGAYDVDMLAVEEKKEYRKRMGRWRTSSMSTVRDPLFDGVVQVMNLCRKPFIHLSNYLKAKVLPTENAPMFRLVVGKGAQIGQEFDDMLWGSGSSSRWRAIISRTDLDSDDDAVWLMYLAFVQILHNASCFHRRVLDTLEAYPQRLMLLVKAHDSDCCEERKQVARELLSAKPDQLEINARKVKTLFNAELTVASIQGVLVGPLRVCMRGVARVWQADTRENERVNKQLKLTAERCPNASVELQSSRACIKHFLGEAGHAGSGSQRRKWSTYKPTALSMLRSCLTAWHDRLQIQEDTTRWQAPEDPELLPQTKLAQIVRRLYPCKVPVSQKNWAACYNMLLSRALHDRESSSDRHHQVPVICFAHRAAGARKSTFSYYVACEKIRSSHRLVECSLSNNGGDDNKWVHVRKPLTFHNSIDVIASHYCNVAGASGMVQICIVPVHRSTASMCDLSLVGAYGTQAPVPVTTLKPPSKKLQKKLCSTDPQHNDSGKDAADVDNGDESGDDVAPDADACGDSEIMEGMHFLMEEAEADADADDDDHGDQEIAAACAALNKATDESSRAFFVSDSIEQDEEILRTDIQEEVMEETMLFADTERAHDALRTGVCPMLPPRVIASFATADMDLDGHAQAVEAVLNQASVMGNSVDYMSSVNDADGQSGGTSGGVSDIASALTQWLSCVQKGVDSLDYYAWSQGKRPGQDQESGVSLVSLPEVSTESTSTNTPSQFVFVQWTDPGIRGRIADFDPNTNRLKCIVPVGNKRTPMNFVEKGASILIPATGVRVLRERRTQSTLHHFQANQVPAVLLRMIDMLRAAQSKLMDDIDLVMDDAVCFVCGQCDSVSDGVGSDVRLAETDPPRTSPSGPLALCPVCLLHSHRGCCDKVLAECHSRVDQGSASWPSPSSSDLPRALRDTGVQGGLDSRLPNEPLEC
ncbi:unnamed protein product [Symbiodinium sp. CCMP2592]|nr:unnamed protein product [Symbiodinium sp. CCMP2592]